MAEANQKETQEEKKVLLIGRQGIEQHRKNVSSQDTRFGKALLTELEISQIKEETHSKEENENASTLTRQRSNFLSSVSPYGED
jgi:hypothetical protein